MEFRQERGVDFESYLWAKSVLWSRCVDFSRELLETAGQALPETKQHLRLLVPGFDMANHDPRLAGTGRTHTVLEGGHVALVASVDYEAGDEVCIFYEKADNHRLLLWYGFVLENNPFDAAQIRLPIDPRAGPGLEALGAVLEEDGGKADEPPPLPHPSDWRRYCAAVVSGFGPQIQVAFHKTVEAKMIAALAAAVKT
ncbi:unnamed protein product [Effrenium voratum]|nr:unnamed protein product [Effrenium voratum]